MEIVVNSIKINYTKQGIGKPLILLHGNGEDLHIFDNLIQELEKSYTVYAIDSRNHGESQKTEDYSYETMAEDIHQFIEQLTLKNVSVVGFSDGAIISLMLALKQPQIFEKMVLLGINLKPTDFKDNIYNYLVEDYKKTKDPLLKLMLEQPNIELKEVENINIPTLLIAAEDDLFESESFEKIVERMPHAQLKIMKGHDHGSYVIGSSVLYPYLKEFLL